MTMTHFDDIKYTDYKSWFEMWYIDKKSMYNTMIKNCLSDINNGYNIHGNCIMKQWQDISNYAKSINDTLDKFVSMNVKQIEKYCYFDLLEHGAID